MHILSCVYSSCVADERVGVTVTVSERVKEHVGVKVGIHERVFVMKKEKEGKSTADSK